MPASDADVRFMRRALQLARRGAGRVSPNPMVGAVVVRDGRIVGEGYHLYRKLHHAEVVALDRAGNRARGATLYVTLEPCAHWGRTPPCMERVAEAGIREVFVAVADPSPQVSGKGVQYLRSRGVRVREGPCGEEARRLNEAFFFFVRHRRTLLPAQAGSHPGWQDRRAGRRFQVDHGRAGEAARAPPPFSLRRRPRGNRDGSGGRSVAGTCGGG